MEYDTILILFMVVVAPLWLILHYSTKHRAIRGLNKEDEEMLGDVWETTKRMEERIDTLERILDDHHPSWRAQSPTTDPRRYQ